MNISVESLRAAGYKIWIRHNRLVINPTAVIANFNPHKPVKPKLMSWSDIKERKYNHYVLARGGLVEVELVNPNGVSVKARAECSKSDAYVKKEGVKIALTRALEKIHSLESFKLDVSSPVKTV